MPYKKKNVIIKLVESNAHDLPKQGPLWKILSFQKYSDVNTDFFHTYFDTYLLKDMLIQQLSYFV